ncbi:MAG: molecular chaperone [Selenomonadaceae bacterium]|nr:molecular chaperone [Selenomonadaceae bacterium]
MEQKKYYEHDLNKMTVYQLQEIARYEKIIPAVANRLDKELLIQTILRYRGAEKALLINDYRPEDYRRLEDAFPHITFQPQPTNLECNAGINVWQGLAVNFFDNITINYAPNLIGTNAFITDSQNNLCCVFNVEAKPNDKNFLYLRKNRNFPCHESQIKIYFLILMERTYSEIFFNYYNNLIPFIQENIPAYSLQLLDFKVYEPKILKMPVAIDFGTSSTTAGVLDFAEKTAAAKFNAEKIRHAIFYDDAGNEVNMIPTVIGVKSLENPDAPEYVYGYDALKLTSYMDEGYTVLYDVKRWIADFDNEEELTDNIGRRVFMSRKKILREFFIYIIHSLEDYIKGRVRSVHISGPVKQRGKFQRMFQEILSDYAVEKREMIDESVAVLYNTISEFIESKTIRNRQKYSALVIDCGGGTTDISSCNFSVDDQRVAYSIDIETGYENGSTDFGGNNLTYRIFQLLKLKIVETLRRRYLTLTPIVKAQREFYGEKDFFDHPTFLKSSAIPTVRQLLKNFNLTIFRDIDENGVASVYQDFENAYNMAEEILPTRFKDWEAKNRSEYFRVRNNYYFLFDLADRIKQAFFENYGVMKVLLTVESNHNKSGRNWELQSQEEESDEDTVKIPIDKWKLTMKNSKGLNLIRHLPDVSFSVFEVEPILNPDIYNIIRQLLDPIYENGELEDYSLIKLSGQSCKIDLFRTALKEFVPGKLIKSKPKTGNVSDKNDLKMSCIDGALKYLRDKKFGYAEINIKNRRPHLPYILTGFTHTGKEVALIDDALSLDRGVLSRNIEDLTLTVYLKDNEKNLRQEIIYECMLDEFEPKRQEEIEKIYGENIPQDETDTIVNGEVKFFVRAEPQDWGFVIVPVYRDDETLYIGKEKFFNFENDQWIKNFFDGLK